MAFQGTTGVVVKIDSYNRTAGTVGAQATLPEKDIESVTFQLPNAKVVRVDGLAEVYEYMLKNGKWVMPDCQVVLKTDITAAGAPLAASAYAILGRPRKPGTRPARSKSPSRPACPSRGRSTRTPCRSICRRTASS